MTRTQIRGAMMLVMVALVACKSSADQTKRLDDEMIAEAKRAAADESTFVADSMKFDSTFTRMPIDSARLQNVKEFDSDGNSTVVTRFLAFSGAKVCQLSKEKFTAVAPNDTIRCQWADKVEP